MKSTPKQNLIAFAFIAAVALLGGALAEHETVDWYRDNKVVVEEGYSTTLLGNDAVKLINAPDPATPIYLYLAFNAAHTPYQATPEYLDRYKHIADCQ